MDSNDGELNKDSLVNRILTGPNHPIARVFSFLLGVALTAFILFFPQLVDPDSTKLSLSMVSLIMLAMSGCFVHGIGFKPYNIVAKTLFSPLLCWSIAAVTFWMWVI